MNKKGLTLLTTPKEHDEKGKAEGSGQKTWSIFLFFIGFKELVKIAGEAVQSTLLYNFLISIKEKYWAKTLMIRNLQNVLSKL